MSVAEAASAQVPPVQVGRQSAHAAQTALAASPVAASASSSRYLRLMLVFLAPAILVFHWSGELVDSPLASALLTVGALLHGVAALPPLRNIGLRDALRDNLYAFSPWVREVLQVCFYLLTTAGWLVETLERHASLAGLLFMSMPQLLMAWASIRKCIELRRPAPDR